MRTAFQFTMDGEKLNSGSNSRKSSKKTAPRTKGVAVIEDAIIAEPSEDEQSSVEADTHTRAPVVADKPDKPAGPSVVGAASDEDILNTLLAAAEPQADSSPGAPSDDALVEDPQPQQKAQSGGFFSGFMSGAAELLKRADERLEAFKRQQEVAFEQRLREDRERRRAAQRVREEALRAARTHEPGGNGSVAHAAANSKLGPRPPSHPAPVSSEPMTFKDELNLYMANMQEPKIPRRPVVNFLFHHGSPEQPGARAIAWKLLLGLLPYDRSLWDEDLKRSREMYASFVTELIVNPFQNLYGKSNPAGDTSVKSTIHRTMSGESLTDSESDGPTVAQLARMSVNDDPLSTSMANAGEDGKQNEWTEFFKDEEVRHEIAKDIKRTYSTFHFFQYRVNPLVKTSAQLNEKPSSTTQLSGSSSSDSRPKRSHGKGKNSILAELVSMDDGDDASGAKPGAKASLFGDDDDETAQTGAPAEDSDDALTKQEQSEQLDEPQKEQTQDQSEEKHSEVSDEKNPEKLFPVADTAADADADSKAEPEPPMKPNSSRDDTHHDCLLRILFIYAKLNPGIRYVQGMNEILAPMYYVFATDPDEKWNIHAEADAFVCFSNVMAELRDRFIKSLDSSSTGIISVVKQVNDLLAQLDKQLYTHLAQLGVDPRFYAFRWLSLLLSQEFDLPDVLRLWDSFFADPDRFTFLVYTCCAMLHIIRVPLLEGGFADALGLLQNYPKEIDVATILNRAHELRASRHAGVHTKTNLVTRITLEQDQR